MNYIDAIEPVTVLKTRSAELIRKAQESGQPVIITQNGKATAVLQDVVSYQRQQQALMLLKYLAQGDHDLREGKVLSDTEAESHFRAKLAALETGGSTNRRFSWACSIVDETSRRS